jgi:hypothetical protein
MLLEDYEKEHNIKVNINLKYEDDISEENTKKSKYFFYQKTEPMIKNNNLNDNYLNKKEYGISRNINFGLQKQISTSTNNSSVDDKNDKNKNIKKIIPTNIKNEIIENKCNNISNPIKNTKICYGYKNNNIYLNNTPNFYNYNNYFLNNNFNNNLNINYIINNNNYNIVLNNFNCMLNNNYFIYLDKLKKNKNNLNDIEKEIKILENKSLNDMILFYQSTDLINYISKKNKILINNNNIDSKSNSNNETENPEHPYFYTNHNEEAQIKNILYLVEGLFYEDNLKNDYNLLIMLNRDGYASLKQLESHPQLNLCKIAEKYLKTVFSVHRVNEITETVETFDDILIRNKNWIKIKKEIKDIESIKQNSLDSMKNLKEFQMKKLLEKKRNYLNIQGDIIYQYQLSIYNIQQKINEFKFNFNNIYNHNFNNNIYNNNNFVYTNYYNNIAY